MPLNYNVVWNILKNNLALLFIEIYRIYFVSASAIQYACVKSDNLIHFQ